MKAKASLVCILLAVWGAGCAVSSSPKPSGDFPRVIPFKSDADSGEMYQQGQTRQIVLINGTSIEATHRGTHLQIDAIDSTGKTNQYRIDADPDSYYTIYPMDRFVLIVHGVTAGPSGAGILLNPGNGNRTSLEIDYSKSAEPMDYVGPMSLYSMSIVQLDLHLFAVAGAGNPSMLLLDLSRATPRLRQIPFQEIPVDNELEAFLKNGRIHYRFRDFSVDAWQSFEGPEAIQPRKP